MAFSLRSHSAAKRAPGSAPGIERMADSSKKPAPGTIPMKCIDFSATDYQELDCSDIEKLIAAPRLPGDSCRWIDIQGIDPYVIARLQESYGIHTLAAEDALHPRQRPKVEDYGDALYVVLRMLRLCGEDVIDEQISFFFFKDTLITVQETPGDVWNAVRARIPKPRSRFRQYGVPYLLYALIDALVDHVFPLLDSYFERLDALEESILENPSPKLHARVHGLKRELTNLRQSIWPTREVVATLQHDEIQALPVEVETFLRDVYDHATRANETVELYRETAHGLQDLLMAAASNRMNEVMKALTIMASLFLPLTFFAGVYGMNFDRMPELHWRYGYASFWAVSAATFFGLLFYFVRKGWIGK